MLGRICTPLSKGLSPFTAWKYVGSQLLATIMLQILHEPKMQLTQTIRCFIRLPGSIALFPTCRSQKMKMTSDAAAPQNSPMIVGELHANSSPLPNWSARRNMTDGGMNSAKPGKSKLRRTLRSIAIESFGFVFASGIGTNVMITAARPPTGKLI